MSMGRSFGLLRGCMVGNKAFVCMCTKGGACSESKRHRSEPKESDLRLKLVRLICVERQHSATGRKLCMQRAM